MSYGNQYSNKPFERASKTSHTGMINDSAVKEFLGTCRTPPSRSDIDDRSIVFQEAGEVSNNPIKHIITVDGGYSNIVVEEAFPSSTITFFQFGVLFFSLSDLLELKEKPFIDPDDFKKMQEIEKLKLVLPTKGVFVDGQRSLTASVRKSLYDFFMKRTEKDKNKNKNRKTFTFMESLKWLLFEEYGNNPSKQWHLARCPHCECGLDFRAHDLDIFFTVRCRECGGEVYLTDVFRLHEAMDDELGASGISGYLATAVEQIAIVSLIHHMLENFPSLLENTLFVKDGPLAFFGQTANLHKPMRNLMRYLDEHHAIYMVGLEKSGPFVEHAAQISEILSERQFVVLGNKHIYKYIIPGAPADGRPYADTSYYGNKVIFKSELGNVYVATLPNLESKPEPTREDCLNIDVVLQNVTALKCDLYYSSLVPIVIANKLISLSDHPSSDVLRRFARENVSANGK